MTSDSKVYEIVSEVWQEVLRCPSPEPKHHFFEDLGGNSLLAFQATVRLRKRLGRPVSLILLFSSPELADYTKNL